MTDGTRSAQREIRLALVLNGGVSLAIWIGGVVAEIDRARRTASAHRAPATRPLDIVSRLWRTHRVLLVGGVLAAVLVAALAVWQLA